MYVKLIVSAKMVGLGGRWFPHEWRLCPAPSWEVVVHPWAAVGGRPVTALASQSRGRWFEPSSRLDHFSLHPSWERGPTHHEVGWHKCWDTRMTTSLPCMSLVKKLIIVQQQ